VDFSTNNDEIVKTGFKMYIQMITIMP